MISLPGSEFFMPMEVYADESGTHNGSKRCVVAGLCGGRRKFKELESAWESLLKEFGIPLEVGFHAKHFFYKNPAGRRRDLYKDWNDAKTLRFLSKAVDLIHTRHAKAIGGAVDVGYFESLPHNLRRWLTGGGYDEQRGKWTSSGAPGKPYFFALHEVIISAADFVHHDGITIDGIFDRHNIYSGLAIDLWNQIKEDPRMKTAKHLGGVAFYSRFDRPCLQIADLIAHCFHHVDSYKQASEHPDICYTLHLIGSRGIHAHKLDAEAIRFLLQGYPAILKEQDDREERSEEVRRGNGKASESSTANRKGCHETGEARASERAPN